MAVDDLRYRASPGPLRRVLGGIGVGALVRSLGDQELNAAEPRVAWDTDRSARLRALARALVTDGRDDSAGAGVLARAAGRHTRELRRAAAVVRADGRVGEDEADFRTDRILRAAAAGVPVVPPTDAQLAWFRRVRDLEALPVDTGYACMAAEEPALLDLEADALHLGRSTPPVGSERDLGDRRRQEVLERATDLADRSPSPVVRTRVARRIAAEHLTAVMAPAVGADGVPPVPPA